MLYCLSLVVYVVVWFLMIIEYIKWMYMAILILQSSFIVTDFAPIAYVIYCHCKSFDRMA